VEQTPAPADEHEESAPGMMILCVGFEMLCQVVDAFAEDGDLHFRRPGVGFVCLVVTYQLRLAIFGQRHRTTSTSGLEPRTGTVRREGRTFKAFGNRDTPYELEFA